jgi:hypothetical protein
VTNTDQHGARRAACAAEVEFCSIQRVRGRVLRCSAYTVQFLRKGIQKEKDRGTWRYRCTLYKNVNVLDIDI